MHENVANVFVYFIPQTFYKSIPVSQNLFAVLWRHLGVVYTSGKDIQPIFCF